MTNPKRRRQTRTRLTTGYPPEWHNQDVAAKKALRRGYRAAVDAQRLLRRMEYAFAALAAFSAPVAITPARVSRTPSCDTCWEATDMTPHHDPSPACESGRRDHCTCDTCY